MSDLSTPDIRVTIEDALARVTLTRPPVNAFTKQMYLDLAAIFRVVGGQADLRCVLLSGEGEKAFSAGFDFKLFAAERAEDDPKRPEILRGMLESVRTCPLPVVAHVNGAAIGAGCVLAACCDICVACEEASFSLPEVDFQRVGGSAYVGARVSKGMLRYMALTGARVSARVAYEARLVDFLLPRAEAGRYAETIAREIAAKSGITLRHTKRALNRIENCPINEGYEIEQLHSIMSRAGLEES